MNNNFWYEIDLQIPNDEIEFCKRTSLNFVKMTKDVFVSNSTGNIKSYGLDSYTSFFFKDGDPCIIENNFFKRIADLLKYTKKHCNYEYVFSRSHVSKITGSLKPHVDFRSCVLSIPVENVKYPIHWYDNEVNPIKIATYEYNGLVLINTKEVHGCPENDQERILFQIGGFGEDEPFDVVKNAIAKRLDEIKNDV